MAKQSIRPLQFKIVKSIPIAFYNIYRLDGEKEKAIYTINSHFDNISIKWGPSDEKILLRYNLFLSEIKTFHENIAYNHSPESARTLIKTIKSMKKYYKALLY